MKVWLPLKIFCWPSESEGGTVFAEEERPRSYDFLRRAEQFLRVPLSPSPHDLADCLSNLRRCFTHRLKLIEKHYQLRLAIDAPKKLHMLELLADVGVIRPLMLQSLLKVRNEVEYNDASPPDVIRCNEFADAVWYLLKTTDSMLEVGRTDIAFRPEGEPRNNPQVWFSLSIEYKPTLKVEFRGQMPRGEIRQSSEAGCFELDLDPTFLKNRKQDGGEQEFLMGQLMLTADHRKEVLKAAFNVVA